MNSRGLFLKFDSEFSNSNRPLIKAKKTGLFRISKGEDDLADRIRRLIPNQINLLFLPNFVAVVARVKHREPLNFSVELLTVRGNQEGMK